MPVHLLCARRLHVVVEREEERAVSQQCAVHRAVKGVRVRIVKSLVDCVRVRE